MCVPCGDGLVNLRVGAIIEKKGKILMVADKRFDYLYSVGGRIKMGETSREAVLREVSEETGAHLEIERLAFIEENYFYGDVPKNKNKLIYELALYYLMKTPEDFEPVSSDFDEEGDTQSLVWVDPKTEMTLYPRFLKTELPCTHDGVQYFLSDERRKGDREDIV